MMWSLVSVAFAGDLILSMKVTGRPVCAASRGRLPAAALSPTRSRYAMIATYPCGSAAASSERTASGSVVAELP